MADPTTGPTTGGTEGATGNDQLAQSFDYAIQQAQQTLQTTTTKGADLYALKQRPQ